MTDRHTDRQTVRHTDRHTDRVRVRERDRQTPTNKQRGACRPMSRHMDSLFQSLSLSVGLSVYLPMSLVVPAQVTSPNLSIASSGAAGAGDCQQPEGWQGLILSEQPPMSANVFTTTRGSHTWLLPRPDVTTVF